MLKIHIDISIFTPNAAFGMISGNLEVAAIPHVGDFIAFMRPFQAKLENGTPFLGQLRVDNRIYYG